MKKGIKGVKVNESLSTRIQFLHICELKSEKSTWCTIGNEILSIDF